MFFFFHFVGYATEALTDHDMHAKDHKNIHAELDDTCSHNPWVENWVFSWRLKHTDTSSLSSIPLQSGLSSSSSRQNLVKK